MPSRADVSLQLAPTLPTKRPSQPGVLLFQSCCATGVVRNERRNQCFPKRTLSDNNTVRERSILCFHGSHRGAQLKISRHESLIKGYSSLRFDVSLQLASTLPTKRGSQPDVLLFQSCCCRSWTQWAAQSMLPKWTLRDNHTVQLESVSHWERAYSYANYRQGTPWSWRHMFP